MLWDGKCHYITSTASSVVVVVLSHVRLSTFMSWTRTLWCVEPLCRQLARTQRTGNTYYIATKPWIYSIHPPYAHHTPSQRAFVWKFRWSCLLLTEKLAFRLRAHLCSFRWIVFTIHLPYNISHPKKHWRTEEYADGYINIKIPKPYIDNYPVLEFGESKH